MTIPHAWHHDQECMDSKTIPLKQNWYKLDNVFFNTAEHSVWFKNQTDTPYQFYNKIILVHSEFNSADIKILQENGYIPVHWFSHAAVARDWYRYAEHDLLLNPQHRTFEKRFLIYNRAWAGSREYRIKFAEMLATHQLLEQCKTSFGFIDNDLHYSKHVFKNASWQPDIVLEDHFNTNTYPSSSSADYDSHDYCTTAIEVVLETIFDYEKIHLTEKTLRSIATGTPFILVGAANALTYLKRYGFETFDPWINEKYDQESNPVTRMQMIIDEMSRLKKLDHSEFTEVMNQCFAIAQRNKDRFFSSEFFDLVINEYRQGMNSAVETCKESISSKNWEKYLEQNGKIPGDVSAVLRHFDLPQ
jgi:predicted nucleic acid-binding protein